MQQKIRKNEIVLQPRASKRKYFFDYHAYIRDCDGNSDLFSRGGGVSAVNKTIAKEKAAGEAMERYCGSHIFKKLIKGSFNEFQKKALNPHRLVYFSESQYTPEFRYKKIDLDQQIGWVEGYSLNKNKDILVPAFAVYLGYNRHSNKDEIVSPTFSNGLALGNTLEEAIFRGILELIERDSIMVLWLLKRQPCRLDMQTVRKMELVSLYNNILSEGLQVTVCIIANNISLVTAIGIIHDPNKLVPYASFGFSSGADIELVSLKALEEALMIRNTLELMKKEDKVSTIKDAEIESFLDHVIYYSFPQHAHKWQFMLKGRLYSLAELETRLMPGSLDFKKVVEGFKRDKKEIFYIDLTTEEVNSMGYKVVRVIIPELQPLYENHKSRVINMERLFEFTTRIKNINMDPHPYG